MISTIHPKVVSAELLREKLTGPNLELKGGKQDLGKAYC